MIFREEMVAKILAGEKTVTRRRIWRLSSTGQFFPCRYQVGKTYAVQPGRGKKAVARIRILDVRRGLIAGVDEAEARAEGFRGMVPDYPPHEEFQDYWANLYGSYDGTQLVDRIEFELVSAKGEDGS